MRSPFAALIVWPLALLLLYGSLGCQGFNFSDGERTGTVYKISHKGFLNLTWEGQLSLGQMVPDAKGMLAADVWPFSVSNETVAHQVEAAARSGKRVTLKYHQRRYRSHYYGETEYDVYEVLTD